MLTYSENPNNSEYARTDDRTYCRQMCPCTTSECACGNFIKRTDRFKSEDYHYPKASILNYRLLGCKERAEKSAKKDNNHNRTAVKQKKKEKGKGELFFHICQIDLRNSFGLQMLLCFVKMR